MYGNVSDLSPMSSNVSSFYLDRIDELLPEKKLIAEKLFKGKDGMYGQDQEDNDTPQNKNINNNSNTSTGRQKINFRKR